MSEMEKRLEFRLDSETMGELDLRKIGILQSVLEQRSRAIKDIARKIDPEKVYREDMLPKEFDEIIELACSLFNDCYACPLVVYCHKKHKLSERCRERIDLYAKVGVCIYCPRLRRCLSENKIRIVIGGEKNGEEKG